MTTASDEAWLILADDLTGAADCAVAFARRGMAATVGWGEGGGSGARARVLSHDVASRALSADAAAAAHRRALDQWLTPDRLLFKKIDSTLRGQPAAEIAATVAHLTAHRGPTLGVFAPAFPAVGRTTVTGRVRVDGRPLEETQTWRRERSYATADLAQMLEDGGVQSQVLSLSAVRARGLQDLLASLEGVVVCDAETDEDLRLIAQACQPRRRGLFFIGSAGLAHALAELGEGQADAAPDLTCADTGLLMVVGSPAAASRAGALKLAAGGGVVHVPVAPDRLLGEPQACAAIGRRVAALLADGADVLVEIALPGEPDLSLGPRLAQALATALAPAARKMSAFAATGGETAAALLSGFGVRGIRLVEEIEPGVSLGLTLGALSLPVVTKAGAFGDEDSLTRIAARLKALRSKESAA